MTGRYLSSKSSKTLEHLEILDGGAAATFKSIQTMELFFFLHELKAYCVGCSTTFINTNLIFQI